MAEKQIAVTVDQRRRCAVLVAIVMLAFRAARADDVPLIPRKLLFKQEDRNAVRLSPDGRKISYLSPGEGGPTLWIAPVGDASKGMPVLGPATQVLNHVWAHTGRHIVFMAPCPGGTHVWALDADDIQTRDLTPLGNIDAYIQKLSVDHPDEILAALKERDANRHDLYVINILTGKRRIVLKNEAGYERVFVDDDWRPRVARRETADLGYELVTLESGGAATTIATFHVGIEAYASQPIGLDKSGRVLYLVDNRGRDKAVLKAIDIESGAETVLCEDPLADIAPNVSFNRRTGEPQACTSSFGRVHRHVLDPALAADYRHLQDALPGDVDVTGRSLDDRFWLVSRMDGGPTRYYVYDRMARRATFLFSEITDLDDAPLAYRCSEVITTRDELSLPADLYLPPWADLDGNGRPHEPLPLLLYVHGGYWGSYPWNSWFTNRCLQLLANRGYAVLRVEFRGAGGFGRKIHEAGLRQPGGKMLEDYVDAADWAVARGIGIRGRIGIWGWSHGGHAALHALMVAPECFACGMSMYGPTDFESFIHSGTPRSQTIWRHYFGDITSDEGRALLCERSPLLHVDMFTKPVLVVQGGKDAIVPQNQADRFVEAMSKQHKTVTYLLYPDEPHDLSDPESWISCFAVAERFFHEHLGGLYEPVGDDLHHPGVQVRHGSEYIPGLAAAMDVVAAEATRADAPSAPANERDATARLEYGVVPVGSLGYRLGKSLTIEGIRASDARRSKMSPKAFPVDTINGRKLDKPITIEVDNVAELPTDTRIVLKGYENGKMIGPVPAAVQAATDRGEAVLSPQVDWQWYPYFVVLEAVKPKLEIRKVDAGVVTQREFEQRERAEENQP